jgi:uncharacterized protein
MAGAGRSKPLRGPARVRRPVCHMIFLSVVVLITVCAHLMLYRFAVRCLEVAHPAARGVLLVVFLLLGVSFVAAFFLLRWDENPLTIGFYKASAVWFALFVKLALAAGATWLIYGLMRAAGSTAMSFRPLAAVCVLLALGWALCGFWSAFHPVVRRIDLTFDRLPENWRNKTIVQLSDIHLGHFHTAAAMERLAKQVNALAPDLVVITGDLFDGMIDGLPTFVDPLRRLKAKNGVFFVTGNHEVYAGQRRCIEIVEQAGIRVLSNEVVDIGGLALMGIAYPGIGGEADIRGLELLSAEGGLRPPGILLFHTPSNILRPPMRDGRSATYWRPDTSFALARKLGVSVQLSGHTHRGQFFPFGLLTRWIYDGYEYGLHREEGFSIYITSGVGTWGPPMRTGAPAEIVAFTLKPAGGLPHPAQQGSGRQSRPD